MDPKPQRPKHRDAALSSLNAAIKLMNLAKETSNLTVAMAVFGSVGVTLAMIRDTMINKTGYVELGLACADVCKTLDRGLNGRRSDELNGSVSKAIEQLAATVAEIQEKIVKRGERGLFSRFGRAKNDKETIASWRSDLDTIINIFNTELVVNERANSSGARRDVAGTRTVIPTTREDTANTRRAVPTIRDGATNTQPTISNAQNDVVNTHAPVSDTYRSISRRQEGTRDDRHSARGRSATSSDTDSAVTAILLATTGITMYSAIC